MQQYNKTADWLRWRHRQPTTCTKTASVITGRRPMLSQHWPRYRELLSVDKLKLTVPSLTPEQTLITHFFTFQVCVLTGFTSISSDLVSSSTNLTNLLGISLPTIFTGNSNKLYYTFKSSLLIYMVMIYVCYTHNT